MFNITDPNSAVFIELTWSDRARVLALAPHEEWAFVVGSTARADFHIDKVGVAPVQFHLERAVDGIWLIPAYGIGDLRVNATRVFGPTPLDDRNVIEFCGVRVQAVIRDANAFAAKSDRFRRSELDTRQLGASYSLDLPGDAQRFSPPPFPSAPSPSPDAALNWKQESQISRQDAARFENPPARAQLKPLVQTAAPTAQHTAWLTKLGLLTKARPLVVLVAATLGACALIVLLVTATRLIESHRNTAGTPAAMTSRGIGEAAQH